MANIRKRLDGRRKPWQVTYNIGECRHRVHFKTKHEAEKFSCELNLRPIDQITGYKNKNTLLVTAVDDYFDTVSKKKARRTAQQEGVWFSDLCSFLEAQSVRFVSEVQLLHLEKFRAELGVRLEPSTINRRFNTYKHFFSKCCDWNLIVSDPTKRLKGLAENEVNTKTWTTSEIKILLSEAELWASRIFRFVARTGARPSSIERLTWADVDYQAKTVRLSTLKGKGGLSYYRLSLPSDLVEFLREIKKEARRSFRGRDIDPVFVNASNNPVSATHICREGRRIIKKVGFNGLTLYGLRHTFITQVANAGGVHQAQVLAGHRNLRTTQRYIQHDEKLLRKTVEAVALDQDF